MSASNFIRGMLRGYLHNDNSHNGAQLLATLSALKQCGGDKDKFIQSLSAALAKINIDEYNDNITHHAEYLNNPINVAYAYWVHTSNTFASSSCLSRVVAVSHIPDNTWYMCLWQLKLTHVDPVCEVIALFISTTLKHVIYDRNNITTSMIDTCYENIAKKNIVSPDCLGLIKHHIELGATNKCQTIFEDKSLADDHIIKSISYAVYAINIIILSINLKSTPRIADVLERVASIGICIDNQNIIGAYIGAYIGESKLPQNTPKLDDNII